MLEELAVLTKELFHAHYAGDLERWFDYLCPDSIYLGTGEPMLFGGSAIREHFKGFEGRAYRKNITPSRWAKRRRRSAAGSR